jgi:hypothetical protein
MRPADRLLACSTDAVFGSCRQLGVGPVAVTSTLIYSGLSSLVPDVSDPNNLATPEQKAQQVRCCTALLHAMMRVLRMHELRGPRHLPGKSMAAAQHSTTSCFISDQPQPTFLSPS